MSSGSDVAALQRLVERLRQRIAFIEGSKFWKLRELWVSARARMGLRPADEVPAIPSREYVEAMDGAEAYTRWLYENEPRAADLARMCDVSPLLRGAVSIAVIVDDVAGGGAAAAASVEAQAYPRTRLVRTSEFAPAASSLAARLNAALAACDDEVVAVCVEGYELAPHATFEVAAAFAREPQSIAAYGDRDRMTADGSRGDPVFAPDWSPETFLSTMYMGPIVFYRREAVGAANGFRDGFGSALHYDLALRVLEDDSSVVHCPCVIVHRRTEHDVAFDDVSRALSAALVRRGEKGTVSPTPCRGVAVVRYEREASKLVEVIVPTRDLAEKLERCLRGVYERNPGVDLRVTVIDNGSVEPATATLLATYRAREPDRFRVLRIDEGFNFSKLINAAVKSCDGPYLLLLNNDAVFVSDDAIAALCEYGARPAIGAVGARLLYADQSLQHAGVVIGVGTLAGHIYRYARPETVAADAAMSGVRNYSAVTAACMFVRRDAFEAVGGFDEGLAVEFNDVDFCLKLRAAGFRNVYLPHVVLRHDESSTRGKIKMTPSFVSRERTLFRDRWRSDRFRDPFYNPNLTRLTEEATPRTS